MRINGAIGRDYRQEVSPVADRNAHQNRQNRKAEPTKRADSIVRVDSPDDFPYEGENRSSEPNGGHTKPTK